MDATVKLIEELTDLALGRTNNAESLAAPSDRTSLRQHLGSAVANSPVDEMPQPSGRGRAAKTMVLKGARFALTRQRAVNQGLVGVVDDLLGEIDLLHVQLDQERRGTAALGASFDAKLTSSARTHQARIDEMRGSLTSRIERVSEVIEQERATIATEIAQRIANSVEEQAAGLRAETTSATTAISELSARVDNLVVDLTLERHRREVLEREVRAVKHDLRVATSQPAADSESSELSRDDQSNDVDRGSLSELYERFERFFRPVGDDLTARFAEYVDDLVHLRDGSIPVVDIGTGRGDFLKVLRDAGIPARGIDTNVDAVEEARRNGLDVTLVDGKRYLEQLPPESVGAITALHVVEHLRPEDLVAMIDQIVRALAPGGVVILETPNPTNLAVGAASFYHDPTHERPLTPDYLAFLLRDRGLTDVETRFLHPLPEFANPIALPEGATGAEGLRLLLEDVRWALKGPQDFAVIARTPSRR